jgi:hypothetical protein
MLRLLLRLARQPLDDYLAALSRFGEGWTWPRLAVVAAAALGSWFAYVPLHELAHAWGCLLGGGSVSRLDIDPIYGAALLQRVFPFVHVGSDYAGQLRGFDPGSDATYLLTDCLPFIGTILIGVPALHAAGRPGRRPLPQAVLFGASLPVAFAPFVSLTGDYYEMGSILVSGIVARLSPGFAVARWRSDDLFRLAGGLFGSGGDGGVGDAVGLLVSFVLGAVLAMLTYGLGNAWAHLLRRVVGREPAAA